MVYLFTAKSIAYYIVVICNIIAYLFKTNLNYTLYYTTIKKVNF